MVTPIAITYKRLNQSKHALWIIKCLKKKHNVLNTFNLNLILSYLFIVSLSIWDKLEGQ